MPAAALALSLSRTPLRQASCDPRLFAHALRATREAGAWTSERWTRQRVQAAGAAEAAGRLGQDLEAYSRAAVGCANALARPEISPQAPPARRRSLRVRAP